MAFHAFSVFQQRRWFKRTNQVRNSKSQIRNPKETEKKEKAKGAASD